MHKIRDRSQMTSEGGDKVILRCATHVHNFPQWCTYCVRRRRSKPPPWVRIPAGARDFLFFRTSRPTALGATQPAINEYGGSFSKRKRPVRMFTTDLYLASKLKNWWSYTSTPPASLGRKQKEIRLVKTNRKDRQSQL